MAEETRYCQYCGAVLTGRQRTRCADCADRKKHWNCGSTAKNGELAGLSLDEVAAMAREAGMSYGQYVAAHEGWRPRRK